MNNTLTKPESKSFDVVPVSDNWEIRDAYGKASYLRLDKGTALRLAWVAAMENRPATARLLNADGTVEKEWNYSA